MILTSISSPTSKFKKVYNKNAIFYCLLMADKIAITIKSEYADLMMTDIDTWSETKIHTTFKYAYRNVESYMVRYEEFLAFAAVVSKVRASKRIDKEGLRLLAINKKVINEFKLDLIFFREQNIYKINYMGEMVPFIREGALQYIPINYEPDARKENGLIAPLVNIFHEKGTILSIDDKFVDMMQHTTFGNPLTPDCDFIKIPLWFFPPFEEISYDLIKYTRDNLQAGLLPFKSQLNQLSVELKEITFTSENLVKIRQLFNQHLAPCIQPVQTLIDQSIYLSQLKNKSKANTGCHFCLGIASAETLVDNFEENETLPPYVASEVKTRLARQINLQSCFVFSFIENRE